MSNIVLDLAKKMPNLQNMDIDLDISKNSNDIVYSELRGALEVAHSLKRSHSETVKNRLLFNIKTQNIAFNEQYQQNPLLFNNKEFRDNIIKAFDKHIESQDTLITNSGLDTDEIDSMRGKHKLESKGSFFKLSEKVINGANNQEFQNLSSFNSEIKMLVREDPSKANLELFKKSQEPLGKFIPIEKLQHDFNTLVVNSTFDKDKRDFTNYIESEKFINMTDNLKSKDLKTFIDTMKSKPYLKDISSKLGMEGQLKDGKPIKGSELDGLIKVEKSKLDDYFRGSLGALFRQSQRKKIEESPNPQLFNIAKLKGDTQGQFSAKLGKKVYKNSFLNSNSNALKSGVGRLDTKRLYDLTDPYNGDILSTKTKKYNTDMFKKEGINTKTIELSIRSSMVDGNYDLNDNYSYIPFLKQISKDNNIPMDILLMQRKKIITGEDNFKLHERLNSLKMANTINLYNNQGDIGKNKTDRAITTGLNNGITIEEISKSLEGTNAIPIIVDDNFDIDDGKGKYDVIHKGLNFETVRTGFFWSKHDEPSRFNIGRLQIKSMYPDINENILDYAVDYFNSGKGKIEFENTMLYSSRVKILKSSDIDDNLINETKRIMISKFLDSHKNKGIEKEQSIMWGGE